MRQIDNKRAFFAAVPPSFARAQFVHTTAPLCGGLLSVQLLCTSATIGYLAQPLARRKIPLLTSAI